MFHDQNIWETLHQTINVVQIRVLIGGLIHLFRVSLGMSHPEISSHVPFNSLLHVLIVDERTLVSMIATVLVLHTQLELLMYTLLI